MYKRISMFFKLLISRNTFNNNFNNSLNESMNPANRKIMKIKLQMLAIDCIRLLKRYYTYKELSKIFQISEALLCRYARGDVIPTFERSWYIMNKVIEHRLLEDIIDRILMLDKSGVVNIYFIAYNDAIIRLAAQRAFMEFYGFDINKVLTAAVNGIPLAIMVSYALDLEIAVAKKTRDAGIIEYFEAQYLTLNPPILSSFYIPRLAIRKNDKILIVDDLLQSGRTLAALNSLVTKADAEVIGLFALISIGNKWERYIPNSVEKVVILKKL